MASTRVRVCAVDQVPGPGETRGYVVEPLAVPVMIANLGGGHLVAATSICPHEDVSLVGGALVGNVVVCPGHSYEFDLDSGRCRHDPSLRLRRFEVSVVGGQLYIEVDLLDRSG